MPYAGKKPRITLGSVGVMPFEGPPDRPGAKNLALAAINAARSGTDPREAIGIRQQTMTLAEVWSQYEAAGFPKSSSVGKKRPATIKADRNRYKNHFAPTIAKEPIENITAARAIRWLDALPSDDIRTLSFALLKALLSFASTRGLAKPHPMKIRTKPSRKVQNFLRADELARLDEALGSLIAARPAQVLGFSAIRLLLLTGARASEILSLKWAMVDFADKVIRLERHKGDDDGKTILLSDAAIAVFANIPRMLSPYVFPSEGRAGHIVDVRVPWEAARKRAQVKRVRLHDLRHSFASAGLANGHSLATIGGLLGHAPGSRQTARYAHLLTETKRAALDGITAAIDKRR
jgi:integrase